MPHGLLGHPTANNRSADTVWEMRVDHASPLQTGRYPPTNCEPGRSASDKVPVRRIHSDATQATESPAITDAHYGTEVA
jgi:hypothetical protein